ncbi:hypothetical protein Agub_g5077, partial [Astrephomene gubernaculifera]
GAEVEAGGEAAGQAAGEGGAPITAEGKAGTGAGAAAGGAAGAAAGEDCAQPPCPQSSPREAHAAAGSWRPPGPLLWSGEAREAGGAAHSGGAAEGHSPVIQGPSPHLERLSWGGQELLLDRSSHPVFRRDKSGGWLRLVGVYRQEAVVLQDRALAAALFETLDAYVRVHRMGWRELFSHFDSQLKGWLSAEEFGRLVGHFLPGATLADVECLQVVLDDNQGITYEMFLELALICRAEGQAVLRVRSPEPQGGPQQEAPADPADAAQEDMRAASTRPHAASTRPHAASGRSGARLPQRDQQPGWFRDPAGRFASGEARGNAGQQQQQQKAGSQGSHRQPAHGSNSSSHAPHPYGSRISAPPHSGQAPPGAFSSSSSNGGGGSGGNNSYRPSSYVSSQKTAPHGGHARPMQAGGPGAGGAGGGNGGGSGGALRPTAAMRQSAPDPRRHQPHGAALHQPAPTPFQQAQALLAALGQLGGSPLLQPRGSPMKQIRASSARPLQASSAAARQEQLQGGAVRPVSGGPPASPLTYMHPLALLPPNEPLVRR